MKKSLSTQVRRFFDFHRPNRYKLKPYLLRDGKMHPVAIIVPGGGYRRICNFSEGCPYAKKLNAMGYHAFVLYYRVKEKARYPAPQDDLARAVRELQGRVKKWKLDMKGYSVWGSSAGGHLAASFGTRNMGYGNYGLPKPGAIILSYPVVTLGEKAHLNSRKFQLGENATEEQIHFASIEKQITPDYPPTFLWWGDEDRDVDPDNSRMLRDTLRGNQVTCICTEYKGVGHGVGIGEGLKCEGWFEKAVAFWELNR